MTELEAKLAATKTTTVDFSKKMYFGDYSITDSNGNKIRKEGNRFLVTKQDDVDCLEYQVKMGRVFKENPNQGE
jgi:hypothetical protein